MILYVLPSSISACITGPSAVPVVVELSNKNGDSVLFTVHDWIFGIGGGLITLAKLSGAGLDSNQHTYYSVVVDVEDLISLIHSWHIRCVDEAAERAEKAAEDEVLLAETDDV